MFIVFSNGKEKKEIVFFPGGMMKVRKKMKLLKNTNSSPQSFLNCAVAEWRGFLKKNNNKKKKDG